MASKKDLEDRGAKCVLVATDFWECTDKDNKVWWCDSESCQPKPRNIGPLQDVEVHLDLRFMRDTETGDIVVAVPGVATRDSHQGRHHHMGNCHDHDSDTRSGDAGTRQELQAEFDKLGREAYLQRVRSAARKALGKLPDGDEAKPLSGEAALVVEQMERLITDGLNAPEWSDARLAHYVTEVGWGRLVAATVAIAMQGKGGGGGGDSCVTECAHEYDRCMAENSCTSSFFCLCCMPCSLQYMGCVARCCRVGGGLGPIIA
jgi:hypothetical protein